MKKAIILLALSAVASASFAQLFEMPGNLESRTISIDGSTPSESSFPVVYSAINGPYSAFAAATGSLGFDDYTSTSGSPFLLRQMRFVGGVTTAGQTLRFDFFDSASNPVGAFTSTLPAGGNFIWSITGLSGLNITLPTSGIVQVSAINGGTGQWFLSQSLPTVGTNDTSFGGAGGGTFVHRLELETVPEPATMSALALGALGVLARRRKK